jgi:glutaredoxin
LLSIFGRLGSKRMGSAWAAGPASVGLKSGFGSMGHGLVTTEPILEIFTNPSCPACSALRLWLKQEGIAFVERDLTDAPAAGKAKLGSDLRGAPLTVNGDHRFDCSLEDRDP